MLVHPCSCQFIIVHVGTLFLVGWSQLILVHVGSFNFILFHVGSSRLLSVHPCSCNPDSVHARSCWFRLVLGSSSLFMLVHHGSWKFMRVHVGSFRYIPAIFYLFWLILVHASSCCSCQFILVHVVTNLRESVISKYPAVFNCFVLLLGIDLTSNSLI